MTHPFLGREFPNPMAPGLALRHHGELLEEAERIRIGRRLALEARRADRARRARRERRRRVIGLAQLVRR